MTDTVGWCPGDRTSPTKLFATESKQGQTVTLSGAGNPWKAGMAAAPIPAGEKP
jgi:hypothetical protein